MFGPWWIISFSLHFFFYSILIVIILFVSVRFPVIWNRISSFLVQIFQLLNRKCFQIIHRIFGFVVCCWKLFWCKKKEREYNSMKALKNWYLVIFNLFWSYWISFFFVLVLRHSRCIVNFQCFNLDVSIINQSWSDLVPNRNPLLGKFSANNSVLFL